MINIIGKKLKSELPLHLMLVPAIVLTIIFSYIPMVGIIIAFKRLNLAMGIWKSKWVGWDNFRMILEMPETGQAIVNTLVISGMKIVLGLAFPIFIALLLNEISKSWFKKTIQTLVYIPYFLSWVILGGIVLEFLSLKGVLNQLIQLLGVDPVFFLGDNRYFRYVLVVTHVWKNFGFNTIIYLAAITSINENLYEACKIDGGNRWRQTWHITLPGMTPIIVLTAVLSLGSVLDGGFDQVYMLYNALVYQTGDIIDTVVYRIGFMQSQYSLAATIGLFKSVVSSILISLSYYIAYKTVKYRIF